MPGSRLTQQERRLIAPGLADGLAYAGIARGLDRPTSIVTREVMRNGGPTGYRADRAHRATERRTRRAGRTAVTRTSARVSSYARSASRSRPQAGGCGCGPRGATLPLAVALLDTQGLVRRERGERRRER
ncbi:Myxococcales GC_trans_RRR domain-containing protein [Streptomyces sp. TLI_053]|uniref:helix-turn-helix domain-containing protein n=1 Tax=Streptomyces sp. TLI_053 TaxID=1855352 RepID=UPI00087AB236|nr:helix-turn-helix domain-containing protein [Streptomyces sp. TLI_053]SDT83078.1 Myxococcales GC_trans_RRR domain-containing protein [Streptomyces sp. TLI_053]